MKSRTEEPFLGSLPSSSLARSPHIPVIAGGHGVWQLDWATMIQLVPLLDALAKDKALERRFLGGGGGDMSAPRLGSCSLSAMTWGCTRSWVRFSTVLYPSWCLRFLFLFPSRTAAHTPHHGHRFCFVSWSLGPRWSGGTYIATLWNSLRCITFCNIIC